MDYCEACGERHRLPVQHEPVHTAVCHICGMLEPCHTIVKVDDPCDDFSGHYSSLDFILSDDDIKDMGKWL